MKKIAVIATGGTIAGKGKEGAAAHYEAASLPLESIVETIPQIQNLAELEMHPVAWKDSNDIDQGDLYRIRQLCEQLEARDDIDGIVITHGTDTLEETSFFLNLVLNVSKPVVITGAMRPATAASADGPMNLYQAVALACEKEAAELGVMALFSNTIFSGRDITKHNSSRVDAFTSSDFGTLGYMQDEKAFLFQKPYRPHTCNSMLNDLDVKDLPTVEIFEVHQNCDPELLKWMLERYDGVIINGTGSGNYPGSIKRVIEEADDSAMIVRASRLPEGLSFPTEVFDPENKTIAAYRLSAPKARILLQLGLNAGLDKEGLRSLFETY